jgi:hypothetical protein
MTRDNLRHKGILKPLECELCKKIEYVSHLFFDCLVSRLLRSEVNEVFNVMVAEFFPLASKWLCKKRYLRIIVISSALCIS